MTALKQDVSTEKRASSPPASAAVTPAELVDRVFPVLHPEEGDHYMRCTSVRGGGTDCDCFACEIVNGEKVTRIRPEMYAAAYHGMHVPGGVAW